MEDLPEDPKTAGLPPHLDERHESFCKVSLCIEFDRILCGLQRWWWRRCATSAFAIASDPDPASTTSTTAT